MITYIGVDPGQTGAIAFIHGDQVDVYDWPGDAVTASAYVTANVSTIKAVAAIEAQHAFPGQGVSSMFKLGMNYGSWLGIMASIGIPTRTVRPQEWQKGMFNKADGKDAHIATARRMFPDAPLNLKKHHGRADALLIADWCRRQSW